MNHITQEQAAKFADQAEIDAERILQDTGEYHPDHHEVEAHLLCNAAIEWYIAQQAAPTKEPNARLILDLFGRYWDLAYQEGEEGVSMSDEANKVLSELRTALYLYNKVQKMNTSQERVQKSEEIKPMLEAALTKAVEISQEYKLPIGRKA